MSPIICRKQNTYGDKFMVTAIPREAKPLRSERKGTINLKKSQNRQRSKTLTDNTGNLAETQDSPTKKWRELPRLPQGTIYNYEQISNTPIGSKTFTDKMGV